MKAMRTLTQDKLDQIVRRIVEVAKPDKIILFGSCKKRGRCFFPLLVLAFPRYATGPPAGSTEDYAPGHGSGGRAAEHLPR